VVVVQLPAHTRLDDVCWTIDGRRVGPATHALTLLALSWARTSNRYVWPDGRPTAKVGVRSPVLMTTNAPPSTLRATS
jgi:hypothetical protein